MMVVMFQCDDHTRDRPVAITVVHIAREVAGALDPDLAEAQCALACATMADDLIAPASSSGDWDALLLAECGRVRVDAPTAEWVERMVSADARLIATTEYAVMAT